MSRESSRDARSLSSSTCLRTLHPLSVVAKLPLPLSSHSLQRAVVVWVACRLCAVFFVVWRARYACTGISRGCDTSLGLIPFRPAVPVRSWLAVDAPALTIVTAAHAAAYRGPPHVEAENESKESNKPVRGLAMKGSLCGFCPRFA